MMSNLFEAIGNNLFPLLAILFLVLLNGFFVAAEFALIGIPKVVVEKLLNEGNKTAVKISKILNNPRRQDRYIATSQLGITLASLGLGMYGENKIAGWLLYLFENSGFIHLNVIAAHSIAIFLAITILSYFHVVIGEMVPKSIALQNTERAAFIITPLMLMVQFIFYPLVIILYGISNRLLKLFGINRQEQNSENFHTSEDLQYIVKESHEGGLIEEESANLIQELLEFGELNAGKIIVPRVKINGIPLGASYNDLIEIVYLSTHTRYPVYDGDLDHIIGIIHIKDILKKLINKKPVLKEDIREVSYISKTTSLNKVFAIMRKTNMQMLIIVDDHGGTDGMVTMEDIFEEVIGEFE
jgi:CBS domain containing-hemolysin-like protein